MDTSYREVAESSARQLQCMDSSSSEDDDWSGEAILIRASGTVVLNRPIQTSTPPSTVPWDIGSYIKTFSSFVKTGVPGRANTICDTQICYGPRECDMQYANGLHAMSSCKVAFSATIILPSMNAACPFAAFGGSMHPCSHTFLVVYIFHNSTSNHTWWLIIEQGLQLNMHLCVLSSCVVVSDYWWLKIDGLLYTVITRELEYDIPQYIQ